MNKLAASCLALSAVAGPAAAHLPQPPATSALVLAWNTEAWLLALMALSALLYARGLARLWGQAGRGRGVAVHQALAFAGGWLALLAALVSPLDALGNQLFSAHMVQHELLMVVAAPLLVLGRPLATWTWALAPAQRRRVGRLLQRRGWAALWGHLTDPLVAWMLHALALWAWHVPALFNVALRHEAWHVAQHASFLGTALLFWWAVLGHDPRGRFGPGPAATYLFTTMLHTGALGALLTHSPVAWYAPYVAEAGRLGLDAVQDQQLGGLVMWVPAGLAYVIAALALLGRLLARVRA